MENQKLSLYEISNAIAKIEELAESETELQEYLDSAQISLQNKVMDVVGYSQSLKAYGEAVKLEAERLSSLSKSIERRSNNLKAYLSYCMQKNGLERIETPIAILSFRKSEQLEIINPEQVPNNFKKVTEIVTIDKLAIKKAINEGEEVAGVQLNHIKNLQIK